ncbi:hypothetical protein K2173_027806 [Erythroxylum novogranatense]|uniref:BZIP domain-containing protein n=1 Tax=Erythroxylum novogranatense TaxID=1862640 RepID=A0AAV8U320_9ROSI|nr:hypothetical protein K2173_027806 [Erythroxylum novogranatense]
MEGGVSESGVQMFQSTFGDHQSSTGKPNFGPDNHNNNKRIGLPPSHHNSPQMTGSKSVSQQLGSQNLNRGPSHSWSLSQPATFSPNGLPPSSPVAQAQYLSNQQTGPGMTNVPMEDRPGSSQGFSIPSPVTGGNMLRANESLPPRRGHRRSMSDSVPLGFSVMIQSSPQLIPIGNKGFGVEDSKMELMRRESGWMRNGSGNIEGISDRRSEGIVVDDLINEYMNLDSIDTWNSSGTEDKDLDSKVSGTKTNDTENSDNEVESRAKGLINNIHGTSLVEKNEGLKRTANEVIGMATQHRRSMSMDSYMENLQLDDEPPKAFPMGTQVGQRLPKNSMDVNLIKFNLEFGNGDFNELELKKIAANEKLAEIAMSDPKRVKRILANRLSAARSKERKLRYISELEQKVQTLQTEVTTLSAQATILQRDSTSLTSQNNELKFRLQALEQQGQLKDALNEALIAEVRRLRVDAAEMTGDAQFPINHRLFQLQQMQSTQQNMFELPEQQNK